MSNNSNYENNELVYDENIIVEEEEILQNNYQNNEVVYDENIIVEEEGILQNNYPDFNEDPYFSHLNLDFIPSNNYCNYKRYENKLPEQNNYKVDLDGPVNPLERDKDPFTRIPDLPPNGGLYGGPQTERPWGSIPVTPTATNYIHNNLLSANPPPGATIQYVSNDRFGNNYSSTPEIKWYNPLSPHLKNKFNIKGI